jgi:hypothetical protein
MPDRRYLEQLRGEARARAESSRIERAVWLLTRYVNFQPFATGPDADLTPDILKQARALKTRRYKQGRNV